MAQHFLPPPSPPPLERCDCLHYGAGRDPTIRARSVISRFRGTTSKFPQGERRKRSDAREGRRKNAPHFPVVSNGMMVAPHCTKNRSLARFVEVWNSWFSSAASGATSYT